MCFSLEKEHKEYITVTTIIITIVITHTVQGRSNKWIAPATPPLCQLLPRLASQCQLSQHAIKLVPHASLSLHTH